MIVAVLYQPLADLNIGCLEIGTSDVKASDVIPLIDDQAKGWRPWPDELLSVACSSLFSAPRILLLTLMFQWSFSVFECRLIIFSKLPP